MRKLILLLVLITFSMYAQEQNFSEKPYYRTQVVVDTLVIPDRIYLKISLLEKENKGKNTEELYKKMLKALQESGVDPQKQLSIQGISSAYDKKFFGTNISKAESYELLVSDASKALKVIEQLEKDGIANVEIVRKEYSQSEKVIQTLKEEALVKAKKDAESLMKTVGQGIGKVLRIEQYNRPYAMAKDLLAAPASYEGIERSYVPDFSPIELQVEFSVVFEIK